MDSSFTTPTKGTKGDAMQSPAQEVKFQSPLARRSLDFDYFGTSPQKKAKLDNDDDHAIEMVKIGNLKEGRQPLTSVEIRVVLFKVFENDKGKTVRIHGLDDTGEIVITAFQPKSLEVLDKVKVNHCYKISNLDVIKSDPVHDSVVKNDLRIIMRDYTKIEDSNAVLPKMTIKPETLENIKQFPKGSTADAVVIIVKNWGLTGSGTTVRRYLSVVDKTACMRLTLWGREAHEFGDDESLIVGLRNVFVEQPPIADGKPCLNSRYTTYVMKGFDGDDADDLLAWFLENERQREKQKADAE